MAKHKHIAIGTVFGRLTVLGEAVRSRRGFRRLHCRCSCGKETIVQLNNLTNAHSQSCGCTRIEHPSQLTHGRTGTPEHRAWVHLKGRCYDTADSGYPNYGGRGIGVCDEWLHDFPALAAHVGPRPSPQHTIERIDNNQGYIPGNVKWATRTEQARNRRSNRLFTREGVTLCAAEWAERYGLTTDRIHDRLQKGWDIERALKQPVRVVRRRV